MGNLFDKVISIDNLKLADEKARKGKLHSYGVQMHDKNREANILALHESLKNGTFHTSQYHVFTIYEPKEREIYQLPYYPDRILHHAVMNILEPIWVSVFTRDIREYMRGLQLKVKRNHQVFPVDARGIDFLGFVFYHTHTLLRKSIKQNLCRRVAKLNKRKKTPTKAAYKQAICSWWGWCKYSDSIHFFNKLSNSFPYEIRFARTKRPL